MIAVAALKCDWSLNHWNIEQAFVQPKLGRYIITRMPEGCDGLLGKIMELANSSYGLKHIPRIFDQRLMSKLFSYGLMRCKSDPSILCLMSADRERVRLVVGGYVDGVVVTEEDMY